MKNTKNKDNPVPSLEKIYEIIDKCIEADGTAQNVRNSIYHYIQKQNGVENYKEQPRSGHMTEISWGSKLHPDEKIG